MDFPMCTTKGRDEKAHPHILADLPRPDFDSFLIKGVEDRRMEMGWQRGKGK